MDKQADEAFRAWRQSPDYQAWNDFKVYNAENGETVGVVLARTAEEHEEAAWRAAVEFQRERDAELVPDTWLDPLLTGPDAVIGRPPLTGPDVQRLLSALKRRVRGESS